MLNENTNGNEYMSPFVSGYICDKIFAKLINAALLTPLMFCCSLPLVFILMYYPLPASHYVSTTSAKL